MRKEVLLTIQTNRNNVCDICAKNEEEFARRQKRYEGLWVCLECDAVIERFLQMSGSTLIRLKEVQNEKE